MGCFFASPSSPKNQLLLFVVIVLYWDLEKGCPGVQLAILRSPLSQELGTFWHWHTVMELLASGLHRQMKRTLSKTRVKGFSFVKCQRQKRPTDRFCGKINSLLMLLLLFCSSPVSGRCINLSSAGLGMYVEFNLLLTTMFSDVWPWPGILYTMYSQDKWSEQRVSYYFISVSVFCVKTKQWIKPGM